MKYTVKNNSNSPHDLMTLKGRVVVLAGKSVEVDFDAGSLGVYEAVPFFEVRVRGEEVFTSNKTGERVIPAPSAENNDPIRRKPGRPPKAA